jgi:hypothetical protein
MKNAEKKWRMSAESANATSMRHQCDIKATPKPLDSQLVGTPKPPQSHSKAPTRLPQSQVHARYKPCAWEGIGRCKPGTCVVRAWYMQGSCEVQATLKPKDGVGMFIARTGDVLFAPARPLLCPLLPCFEAVTSQTAPNSPIYCPQALFVLPEECVPGILWPDGAAV